MSVSGSNQKKGGTAQFCVDYRELSRRMRKDKWPLPGIEEIFDDLRGNSWFTSLDLFSGYWQISMHRKDKHKITIVWRMGTFKLEVMPFRLMNAPSTFQRMMNTVFSEHEFVTAYLDDVIIFSNSLEDHLDSFRTVC